MSFGARPVSSTTTRGAAGGVPTRLSSGSAWARRVAMEPGPLHPHPHGGGHGAHPEYPPPGNADGFGNVDGLGNVEGLGKVDGLGNVDGFADTADAKTTWFTWARNPRARRSWAREIGSGT